MPAKARGVVNDDAGDEEFVISFKSVDCLVAAIDRLRALFGDQLKLTGSTREVCRQYETLNCAEVHFIPFTALRPMLPTRQDHVVASPPLIVSAGHFGARKGLNHIPALIRELDRRGIPARWAIGGDFLPDRLPQTLPKLNFLRSQPNVSLVSRPEGLSEYDYLLKGADLGLLPYSPNLYQQRGSGVSEEAELLGLPYVAPKVVFSGEAISAGAAVSFEEWTVDGIATALAEAVRKLPQLTRAAEALSRRRHEELRTVREKFLPSIFQNTEEEAAFAAAPAAQLPGVDIIVTLHNYRRFLARSA